MNAKCSRCLKRKPILFEAEWITNRTGIRSFQLCDSCTKWALTSIIHSTDGRKFFEIIYGQVQDIADFIKRKSVETKAIKQVALHSTTDPVPSVEPHK